MNQYISVYRTHFINKHHWLCCQSSIQSLIFDCQTSFLSRQLARLSNDLVCANRIWNFPDSELWLKVNNPVLICHWYLDSFIKLAGTRHEEIFWIYHNLLWKFSIRRTARKPSIPNPELRFENSDLRTRPKELKF